MVYIDDWLYMYLLGRVYLSIIDVGSVMRYFLFINFLYGRFYDFIRYKL